jgi:Protein of unknown function (DUF1064)
VTAWHKPRFKPIRTVVDSIMFDSKREASRYSNLKILMLGGRIRDLETHPAYDISINGKHICVVKLDFKYWSNETNSLVYEDSKGFDTPISRLKRKLVEAQHGIKVTIV